MTPAFVELCAINTETEGRLAVALAQLGAERVTVCPTCAYTQFRHTPDCVTADAARRVTGALRQIQDAKR